MTVPRTVFWSCLAGALAALADRNITIDDTDPRVVFSGTWTHGNDVSLADRYNVTSSFTTSAGATATLKFNGTAVYFMTYGRLPPEPDTYQVTFDGQNELQSLKIDPNGIRPQFIAYRKTGLDASQEHTITISDLGTTDLNIDAFIITVPDNGANNTNNTNSTSSTIAPSSGASTMQSDQQSGPSTSVKVGIAAAVVGVFLGLLGGLGIHLWWRRRSQRHTLNPPINTEGQTSYIQSTYVPNVRASAFGGTVTDVSTRPGSTREDRSLTGGTTQISAERDILLSPKSVSGGVVAPPPYGR